MFFNWQSKVAIKREKKKISSSEREQLDPEGGNSFGNPHGGTSKKRVLCDYTAIILPFH